MALKDLVIRPLLKKVLEAIHRAGLHDPRAIAEHLKVPLDCVETAIGEGIAKGLIERRLE